MCGIAGVLTLTDQECSVSAVQGMSAQLAHRGPDGRGTWVEGPVGLAHTRLAVLDLRAVANQPMQTSDGRFLLVFNGEIYNFRDLRRMLTRSGSVFRTESDTEVLLEAIARWGPDKTVRQLNGMFAFAVWDRTDQRLILARDRYGVKPLYLLRQGPLFAFASEPKAFTALPAFRKRLDAGAVLEYFTFQNILTQHTFWEGVETFPAGHWAEISLAHTKPILRHTRYWDFRFDVSGSGDMREYAEELRRLTGLAVDRQLTSDVEVGAFLSGGLDSGSIVAFASRVVPDFKVFTVGFDSQENSHQGDERPLAEYVSNFLGTTQFEMVLGSRHVLPAVHRIARHVEDPRVGQSYPNLLASQLARAFVKVALAGTGGDEILGGYPWRYPPRSYSLDEARVWHLNLWQRLMSRDEHLIALKPLVDSAPDFDPEAMHADIFSRGRVSSNEHHAAMESALYFEAKTFLPGLLSIEDRLSMAYGLETRVPFLDNDLVDFAMGLPLSMRTDAVNGREDLSSTSQSRGEGKVLLRRAMSGLLPDHVLKAPKRGFSVPDQAWFQGELREHIVREVRRLDGVAFDADFTCRHWLSDEAPAANRLLAWSLLVGSLAIRQVVE